MCGKKGDPKHSSASLNARHCCFPLRKAPWAAADTQRIPRVWKTEKAAERAEEEGGLQGLKRKITNTATGNRTFEGKNSGTVETAPRLTAGDNALH